MKALKLFYAVLFGLLALSACKKEPIPEPNPQTGCKSCYCNEFNSAGINQSFSDKGYGSVFYYQAYTSMVGRYMDYSSNGFGKGTVEVVKADAIWQAENSNFSGEVFRFADADVLFNYDDYKSASKTVSFDVNLNSGYTFKIDGKNYDSPPAGVSVYVTHLKKGKHIEVSGTFSNIELGGWELAIDNMCTQDYKPVSGIEICDGFEDTVYNAICPSSQKTFGAPFMVSNGVSYRSKYIDYEGQSFLGGSVHWGAPNSFGTDENTNFSQQLLQVNNVDLELDFTGLGYMNRRVSFDISNAWKINNPNEFMVNGLAKSSVPSGISYNITSLGNAKNGNPCYHVSIEGSINSIVLVGWEITYDNMCIQRL